MANRLIFTDTCIEIHCERNDVETIRLLSQIYPVHKNRINTLFKVSLRLVPEVLQLFRGVSWENIHTAPRKVQVLWEREQRARVDTAALLSGTEILDNPVVNQHLTLKPHQQIARQMSKVRNRFGFFYDTRTGKTPMSLAIIHDDIMENPTHKWLVVCPLILIENAWLEDATGFFPDMKVVSCHATTKDKRLKAMKKEASVYIANTESFVAYRQYYDEMGFYGCFVDESSDMKSTKSHIGVELVDFSKSMEKWYLLSGAPAPNGEWEYYRQLQSIDYYGVPQSYTQFKEYYFVDVSWTGFEKLEVNPARHEELIDTLRTYSFYVDKEDVLTTPGRTFNEVEYDMAPEVKAAYTKMKNELYVELKEEKYITAPSAAAKLNKLNQITSGFIIDTEAKKQNKEHKTNLTEVYLLDNKRFELLYDLLDKQGNKQVLIWANYREEFRILKEHFGNKCACVYGGVNIQEKTEAIRAFKNGTVQYLIANPASADKGLTLTNCHICVYFSLNWSYELFKQSMERIYADVSKQPNHCQYYIIMANGTIDGVLYRDVLQRKADASNSVLNHLKGGI